MQTVSPPSPKELGSQRLCSESLVSVFLSCNNMMVSPESSLMQLKDASLKSLKHLQTLRAPTSSPAVFKDLFLGGSPFN